MNGEAEIAEVMKARTATRAAEGLAQEAAVAQQEQALQSLENAGKAPWQQALAKQEAFKKQVDGKSARGDARWRYEMDQIKNVEEDGLAQQIAASNARKAFDAMSVEDQMKWGR
jgi:hypothetical protein